MLLPPLPSPQVANATTVYVRRPGNPKKWRALVTCLGKPCDLALLTVEEEEFWTDLKPLNFLKDVPELQVRTWGGGCRRGRGGGAWGGMGRFRGLGTGAAPPRGCAGTAGGGLVVGGEGGEGGGGGTR